MVSADFTIWVALTQEKAGAVANNCWQPCSRTAVTCYITYTYTTYIISSKVLKDDRKIHLTVSMPHGYREMRGPPPSSEPPIRSQWGFVTHGRAWYENIQLESQDISDLKFTIALLHGTAGSHAVFSSLPWVWMTPLTRVAALYMLPACWWL